MTAQVRLGGRIVARRGGVTVERMVRRDAQGVVWLRQRFHGDGVRVIVTHDAALSSRVEVEEGAVSFPLAGGEIEAPRSFVLEVPPRSVLPIRFARARVDSDGVGCFGRSPGTPHIRVGDSRVALDPDHGVAERIVRARRTLHERLGSLAPVRAAALAAGIHPDVLARGFTRAYGLGPKVYCHRARLFDAAIRLYEGLAIADAALSSGFNDLSRFYRQFRRLLGTTPGEYFAAGVGKRRDPEARGP